MQHSSLTSKGQVTIPAEIRHRFGLKPGDQVGFRIVGNEIRLIKNENRVDAAFGLIKSDRSVSDQEMEQAIRLRAGK